MFSPREDATSGDYFVRIDEYLSAAVEQHSDQGRGRDDGGEAKLEQAPVSPPAPSVPRHPRPASDLSPREIQARLRSGSTIAEVAQEAGVNEDWIGRFAAPILAEQSRVVQQAQQLTFDRPRVGPSSQPLRTSVRWNLAEQGALRDDEVFDAGWSAFNLHGSRWVVRFSFVAKRRRKLAEWEVDLRTGELTALNRVATDLGYVEPGSRRRRPPDELPPAPQAPRRRSARGRSAKAAGKATGKSRPATIKKGPAARKSGQVSKGSGAKKSAGSKASLRKAVPAPTKGRRSAAEKVASKKAAARKSGPPTGPARRAPAKSATGKRPAPQKAMAKKAPVKKAPVKKVTAKKVTAKKAPAKSAPAKKVTKGPAVPRPALAPPGPPSSSPSLPSSGASSGSPPPARAAGRPRTVATEIRPPTMALPSPAPAPPAPEEEAPQRTEQAVPPPTRAPLVILSTPDAPADADDDAPAPGPRRLFSRHPRHEEDSGVVGWPSHEVEAPSVVGRPSSPAVRLRPDLPSGPDDELDSGTAPPPQPPGR